jgi:hypothetical protein
MFFLTLLLLMFLFASFLQVSLVVFWMVVPVLRIRSIGQHVLSLVMVFLRRTFGGEFGVPLLFRLTDRPSIGSISTPFLSDNVSSLSQMMMLTFTAITVLMPCSPFATLFMRVLSLNRSGGTLLVSFPALPFPFPLPCTHGLLVVLLTWDAPMGSNCKQGMPLLSTLCGTSRFRLDFMVPGGRVWLYLGYLLFGFVNISPP